MAESPAYWDMATRLVHAEMDAHQRAMMNGVVGGTLPKGIVDALVQGGFMEKPDRIEHNHFTRDPQPDTCDVCATYTDQQIEAYNRRLAVQSTPADLNPQNQNPER